MTDSPFAGVSTHRLEAQLRSLKDQIAAVRTELQQRYDAKRYRNAGRQSRLTRERKAANR